MSILACCENFLVLTESFSTHQQYWHRVSVLAKTIDTRSQYSETVWHFASTECEYWQSVSTLCKYWHPVSTCTKYWKSFRTLCEYWQGVSTLCEYWQGTHTHYWHPVNIPNKLLPVYSHCFSSVAFSLLAKCMRFKLA